ncbi:MAG: ATP-grasp domain-containing protein [Treponema phagedenis]|uniref:ATP-grasp domain-containing protein n=1 Tax=Treponema phagedenis TaxID=162 RepID=A0A0B7GSD6_TREPH|nr:ATP-grasp domain-containing protein [Treponema phagedenis]QEJ95412.1 ATP-grasp domain-containing protein [Treponema phagedenis]QSH93532.1 ATP-grasp domain-containing protein [Treponema phagedenis]CEM60417.1 conserved hypothetical protein [Treponema phagedenis]
MKEKLVIIGANDFQAQLIRKAKKLGYETHVFAWEKDAIGKTDSDYFYPISIINKDEILSECKKIKPQGICSLGSDLANITVQYIAQELGLVSNSPYCVLVSTNKHEMRKVFEKNNDPSPRSILVDMSVDFNSIDLSFPVIVKPTDRSGSRGITKIFYRKDLGKAIQFSCHESFEKKALVEEFAEGKEYSVEYISYKGLHTFIALTEKFTTGHPHYIEYGHKQPALLESKNLIEIQKVVSNALTHLNIEYGASHTEIKIDGDNNIKIIEIGSRGGGDCIASDLVPLSTGYDYMKMIIDISCGKVPDFSKGSHYKNAMIKFLLTQTDIKQLKEVKKKDSFIRESILQKKIIGNVLDSSGRYGYYILAK